MKLPRETRPATATIRSRVVLEIASELVGRKDQTNIQAKVLLRPARGDKEWRLALFGSSTTEGIAAVASGEADLAITNPSAALSVAVRGNGMFKAPQPVRPIAVIPSFDLCLFGVRGDLGITHIEEIAERKLPLRLSLRGERDHYLQPMLDDILAACGCSLADIERWGGKIAYGGTLPYFNGPRMDAYRNGEIDAIFDESVTNWCNDAPTIGMRFLQMREDTVRKLEALGYRRGIVPKADFPNLQEDVLSLDFSGWPILVRADASGEFVTQVCEALAARADRIPWQSPGPLPVARMCREAPDTPQLVPLHPAATRVWRALGYLDQPGLG
ncbi:MAG TPA: TAXI family TRAP transporter solute-binding subunit [Alphaproteobacteria bacterium]|nr:TAXI family TRAP transporter solute-binding subunit [Alphaproteobacteria bacterium]